MLCVCYKAGDLWYFSRLVHCGITNEGFAALMVALKSNPSHLRELNLNHSKPDNSGVKELSGLLEDPLCKLEKLQ